MKIRCALCRRRWDGVDTRWNATVVAGNVTSVTCGACQTAEENAEAEVNEATLRYETDAFGRLRGRPA